MSTVTARPAYGSADDLAGIIDLLATPDVIAEFAEHLEDLGRSEGTITTYTETLRQMDRELPDGLYSASEPELTRWLRGPADHPWSKATRYQRRSIMNTFFAFACDPRRSPHLDYNPTLYLPRVRVPRRAPRPAPDQALTDILGRAQGQNRISFILAAYGGARCCEVAALDREDVTERSMLLQGKGERSRIVPTHARVWEAVMDLPPGPVVSDQGRRLTRRQVSRRGNRALRRLGYSKITMHMLRHLFATRANDVVGDLRVVQELLGHASVATTQIYVQTSRRKMEDAVNGLT